MKALKNKYLLHVFVWLSYYLLLIWFYNETSKIEPGFLKATYTAVVQAGVFYLNLLILLPRYFENKKYTVYGLHVLGLLVVSMALIYLFDQMVFRLEVNDQLRSASWRELKNANPDSDPGPPREGLFSFGRLHWRHLLFNGFFIVVVLFLSTIYYSISSSVKKEKESLILKNRITEAESNMLKSQINPHFLFNTLNNIYSMAQLKSDHTADAVHRLSEMLRYVIYECNKEFVKLEQEINYLKSYIALNLLKDENLDNIQYDFDHCDGTLLLAPMILIPFVENSFKHSNFENKQSAWINIHLSTSENQLLLRVSNTIGGHAMRKDSARGIGLDNVKKRLQLIYPNKHFLNQSTLKGIYNIELMIDLDENKLPDR